ncbi:hypothetical protein [Planktomarina sp.]|uniref:hypothetical protein n=1 Tax=Planktomarina sp. TaxID=2024851 RepID=UPI00325FFAE0
MIIDNSGTGIASLGRDEDRFVAHVAPGERVIPPVISADTQARLSREMMAAGLDPDEYIVGPHMSINPITGQPEFGWLKKTFKSVKKVAKKVAPVAMFIPGVGQALGAVGGSLLGKVGLGNVASGIGGLVGKIPGLGGVGNAITAGSGGGLGSALSFGKQAITSGIGGLFTPKGMMGQAMQGGFAPSEQGGYVPGYNIPQQYYGGGFMPTFGYSPGYQMPSSPSGYDPATGSGQSRIGLIEDFIKGNRSGYDPRTGSGQSRIGMIEDFIKGGASGIKDTFTKEGGGLNTLGAGGLAALVGKIAYDQAKSRSGGLAETPAVTMDQLGRYQISKALGTGGTREEFGLAPAPKALKFAQGGAVMIEELDMRDGGESAGPGTGTSDDIPAMLSDGEFVMTAKATRGAGAFDVNKTKSGIELIKGGSASREEGVKNMRELMNIFEAI